MKKLLLLTFLFMFTIQSPGFAAVSGSKPRTFSPTPKPPTTQTAPAPTSGYKPSSPANSYSQTAPAAKSANPSAVQQPASGGFMRGLGLFGGGMLLGSLLGGTLGFGSTGGFATLSGLFFNILIIGGIIMAGRFIWEKFKQRQRDNNR
ncbi:hypothetical protein [Sporomusa sp.]|uniref:hypothetical protein n=1 Tax=Sporomusa sp. TaxID=2078658 RepID=UPI002BC1D39C|nr:hypothetical protein [Sporomusa sp.]HWR42444.1 hypothetical protein [Sporomusa sp.]